MRFGKHRSKKTAVKKKKKILITIFKKDHDTFPIYKTCFDVALTSSDKISRCQSQEMDDLSH